MISLAFIVLVTIIVLAISAGVRVERMSSSSSLQKTRAEFFAQMGVDEAVARLRTATGNSNVVWVSQPGRLLVSDGTTNRRLTKEILLHSGTNTTNAPSLNIPAYCGSGFLIANPPDPDPMPMRVDWIPVTDTNGTNVSTNGRYAFWTDDESTKVNCNLAWTRRATNTNGPGSPTRINLEALEGFDANAADALHFAVAGNNYEKVRFFNSPSDARRVTNNSLPALLATNKFQITHYNHSPDTTYFNEPRIVLTTQKNKANALPFLDILKTPNTDPGGGLTTTLDNGKLTTTIALLRNYLERKDWPMISGQRSLQDKYYGGASQRLAQMAINIIDYVRSKESTSDVVIPLRGQYGSDGSFYSPAVPGIPIGSDVFFGVSRTPMINELAVWLSPDRKQLKVKVELFLPPRYGIASFSIPANILFVRVYDYLGGQSAPVTAAECSSATLTPLNPYATITRTLTVPVPVGSPPRPKKIFIRVAFQNGLGAIDIAPLMDAKILSCPVDAAGVLEADIKSIEVSDPRVNKHPGDWTVVEKNSLGAQNSIYKTGDITLRPQLDTEANGTTISDASLFMPPPKGKSGNLSGAILSTGELGYVHTGVEGTANPGVPWRTFRLQPNSFANTSDVPDWALLDIFTVPTEIPPAGIGLFRPHADAVSGRININAEILPFNIKRQKPIAALLQGARTHFTVPASIVTPEKAVEIADNVITRKLAISGKAYGHPDVFDSPGEIVEIAGIADGGEETEELVRSLGNLMTARSNVFGIYVIGQSLNPKTGKVTGEQRMHFIVERYVENGAVRFRTIFASPLTQ
ncbi:MAG: hypothetical protein WC765_00700 [Phycisphaerae bacterium]